MSERRVVVTCSQGHRFPVNLDKHRDRKHVFCPRCRDKVVVRKKHFFSPNPNWYKQKAEQTWLRTKMKEMRKPPAQMPSIRIPLSIPIMSEAMQELRIEREKENR